MYIRFREKGCIRLLGNAAEFCFPKSLLDGIVSCCTVLGGSNTMVRDVHCPKKLENNFDTVDARNVFGFSIL